MFDVSANVFIDATSTRPVCYGHRKYPRGMGNAMRAKGKTKRTTGETPARRERTPGNATRTARNGATNAHQGEVARMSDERRQQIVDAARQLYEEQGLSATTVKDISERCGVARSLFYHYFRNKQEVTSAVIDDFVNDYIESLQFWNEHRTPGDIEGSLAGVVTVMRVGVFEHSSFRRALDTHENASLYLEFINRVADRMAAYFVETTVQDYAQNHPIDIDHVYETFYILIMGICGYVRTHRDAPDEVLCDIIAQTLHMERKTKPKPVQTG